MSDISDHSCDADVARSGATCNHDFMHDQEMSDISNHLLSCDADVDGSGATCNRVSTLDQEMSDISDPLLSCDADVVGSGATCNRVSTLNQEMSDISDPLLSCDADVVGSSATCNHDSILDRESFSCDGGVVGSGASLNRLTPNVLLSEENIRHLSFAPKLDTNAAAISLSGLFSTIEYANKAFYFAWPKNIMFNFHLNVVLRFYVNSLYFIYVTENVQDQMLMLAFNMLEVILCSPAFHMY
jgi:hypothetical protein